MTLYSGLDILDGTGRRQDQILRVLDGTITECRPRAAHDHGTSLAQGSTRALICPGFVDLQVNGGGGLMLDQCQSPEDLSTLAAAHRAGGTLGLLPTLISDTPETTARIIDLVVNASTRDQRVLGLHLEGPHLEIAGAHDPARLRPMTRDDLHLYCEAAHRLPHLLLTVAPKQVSRSQISALTEAGATVFLGHTPCSYDAALADFEAGAVGVTHLFNAMSGLHHRAPGLVGAALDHARWIGLIADGHHVHPAALRLAARMKPESVCLVSDAMALAGTSGSHFSLGGRHIRRSGGRLVLPDGTLAGADLTQFDAARRMAEVSGLSLAETLPMAFDTPHRALTGAPARIETGQPARLLHIQHDTLIATLTDEQWNPV